MLQEGVLQVNYGVCPFFVYGSAIHTKQYMSGMLLNTTHESTWNLEPATCI